METQLAEGCLGICKKCGLPAMYHIRYCEDDIEVDDTWWTHLIVPEDEHDIYVALEDVPKFTKIVNALLDTIIHDLSEFDAYELSPPDNWAQVRDALALWKVHDE